MTDVRSGVAATVEEFLAESGLEWEVGARPEPGQPAADPARHQVPLVGRHVLAAHAGDRDARAGCGGVGRRAAAHPDLVAQVEGEPHGVEAGTEVGRGRRDGDVDVARRQGDVPGGHPRPRARATSTTSASR